MICQSIVETVGKTPIVELRKLAPAGVRLFGKLESFNPGGSVKDRLALAVIERAEQEGRLKPGQTVVEATSGNTGIGLALVCAAKGYPLVVTMAESFSIERRLLMRFLGAKVVLTPASLKGSGMYLKALELAETHGWFLPRQFENEANADIHERTTGQEILRDFDGQRLDYVVTTVGTGGTLKGVARALRAGRPQTKVVVAEAENAALIGSGLPQPPSIDGVPQSHPRFQPHPIQGTTPDFISKLAGDAIEAGLIDHVAPVKGAEALRLARELAVREGVLAGISSGAALAAAMQIAETAEPGATILCLLPDTGERYQSTPLFEQVGAEMDAEERAISASTPSARFDAPPAPPPAAPVTPPAVDAEAQARVDAAIAERPVVLFSLEWCEFSWSLRKLLGALGVAYADVALDAAELASADLGLRMRRALGRRTGVTTIPQIFIGGVFIGGCMDAFAEYRSGALQQRLATAGFDIGGAARFNPDDFLPRWVTRKLKLEGADA
jgi:cysteine synthase A